MPDIEAVADEYRLAYEQLKHLKAQQRTIEEQMERDFDLAWKRYEGAQRAYLELALGEDDQFLKGE